MRTLFALVLLLSPPAASDPPSMLGFSPEQAAQQRALEARFDSHLRAENLRDWMKRLTARPHPLGSPWGKVNADFMVSLLRSCGWEAELEEFHVLFPTPKTRVLELVAPHRFTAKLAEPALAADSTSGQTAEQLPTYNAYSSDGEATGELVFANYGLPRDYEELARRGIDVKGKIVIVRYYGTMRGMKPKVAAEHGAVACIIYTDPEDDGYFWGDVYPKGGWRPDTGVQRGSVTDLPLMAGDPLTPGVGATKDAKRLPIETAPTITAIPVLPISAADALPLLAALGGPMAPEAWRGALPIPYRLGPGPAKVHLKLAFDWKIVPAYDVIAKWRGAELPDEWIVRGSHHDAWVNGAHDPVASMVSVLEEARAIGELVKTGWRPRRTLVYAGWDGEEQALMGSTEWVETHAEALREKAVAYINSDGNSRGFLGVGGSHTLERLANEVARDVVDPQKGVSVAERWIAAAQIWELPEAVDEERQSFHLDALGSGSDFTPFLQHLGVASLNVGYGGEEQYGQYHSIYDSFDHYVRFVDPDFRYGVALAQTAGRMTLRLAQAELLPFDLGPFAAAVSKYAEDVQGLADRLRKEATERTEMLADRVYELVADPTETWVTPPPLDPVPYLSFAPLQNAVARLSKSTAAFEKSRAALAGKPPAPETRDAVNAILLRLERSLTRPEGLPGRPWYKHHAYAPGRYAGYRVSTLPAVREAIEQRRWREADEQIVVLAKALELYAAEVDKATALLESAGSSNPGGL